MKWNSILYDASHDFVAKYGEGLLSYLRPEPGEHILDLGCGTGDLTHKIFLAGAKVLGVDNSAEMIEKARAKFPDIQFMQMDARELQLVPKASLCEKPFDAIFSNAALHWVKEKEEVIAGMSAALRPGGRIVLEFGGKGNIEKMSDELRRCLNNRGHEKNATLRFWYFPSIGEYAVELEKKNFRVVHAEHFDRFTPLKGNEGIKDWFLMFGENFFQGISDSEKEDILNEVQNNLHTTHLVDGVWHADYKRIRIVALKE